MAVTDVQTMTVNGRTVKLATNFEIRPGYSPYVGDNGNWYVYDVTVKGFVDTGVSASGNGIATITKTGTSGIVDTYTITFDNGTTTTFTVTNADNSKINAVLADIATVQNTTTASKNYAVGELLLLNGQLYKVTSAIATGATIIVGSNVVATTVEAELEILDAEKADIYGTYHGMTVGNADQLNSTEYVEDKVPYKFRVSGNYADIGNREEDTIVGGSIAWNQLRMNEITSYNYEGIITSYDSTTHKFCLENVSRTANYNSGSTQLFMSNSPVIKGHIYLFDTDADTGIYALPVIGATIMLSGFPKRLFRATDDATSFRLRVTYEYDFVTKHPVNDKHYFYGNIFDITQMFGATIADYIYSVEQSQAGAGVALFRNLFPNSFYEYNAGTLMSVEGLESHDMVGFNQWDENWELGAYNTTTGQKQDLSTAIRNVSPIRILPNTTYYFKKPSGKTARVFRYDSNMNLLSTTVYENATPLFTTESIAMYFNFHIAGMTEYQDGICLNLSHSGAKNGTYESYQKSSYPLDNTLTLRGVPKLGADNKMYYDGDIYAPDGTVTRRYDIVDMGTLIWTASSSTANCFYANIYASAGKKFALGSTSMLCTKYVFTGAKNASPYYGDDKTIQCYYRYDTTSPSEIYVHDSTYSTAAAFKTAMSGVYLVYELATPTTETADPYASHQVVNDWGTEEYVSGNLVPVGHDTKYPANLRDKLQHLPNLASADGIYAIQQSGSDMTLVHIPADVAELPDAPTSNGVYTLKVTVSDGTATYSWAN